MLDFPAASVFAGIERVALPLLRFPEVEKLPLDSVTVPVGVTEPAPITVTDTDRASAGLMLDWDGVTVTVGVFLDPPLQPMPKREAETNKSTTTKPAFVRRLLPGRKKHTRAASVVVIAAPNHPFVRASGPRIAAGAAVVATVIKPVAGPDVIVTELPVNVGVLVAPVGDDVAAALKVTVPV